MGHATSSPILGVVSLFNFRIFSECGVASQCQNHTLLHVAFIIIYNIQENGWGNIGDGQFRAMLLDFEL